MAPDDIGSLVSLLSKLERGVSGGNLRVSYRGLFGAPLDAEYLDGGWTSHLAAFDRPEAAERHLDFYGPPNSTAVSIAAEREIRATANGRSRGSPRREF